MVDRARPIILLAAFGCWPLTAAAQEADPASTEIQYAFEKRDGTIGSYHQSRVWTDLMDCMDEYFEKQNRVGTRVDCATCGALP